MPVRFESHADDVLTRLDSGVHAALEAAGQRAVAAVRQQMLTGYAQPVHESGALLESIGCAVEDHTLHVGTSVPYASFVHDGTARTPGRPFLSDGILGCTDDMASAAAKALSDIFA